jgi:hypothetical protein
MGFEIEHLTASELLEELMVQAYNPPLVTFRSTRRTPIEGCLHRLLLFIDFDTEVSMQGILGFLENSNGEFLPDVIAMFEDIGATETSTLLREIARIMEQQGLTHARLRQDLEGHEEYELTSFSKLHGPEAATVGNLIDVKARSLYLYRSNGEDVVGCVQGYIEKHRSGINAEIRNAGV